jgi:NADPH:quinone reductase-like Zn-dependent oxidoreductase
MRACRTDEYDDLDGLVRHDVPTPQPGSNEAVVRIRARSTLTLPGGSVDAQSPRSLVTLRRLFVGSRSTFEAMNRAIETHTLRPVIDRVVPFESARDAYARLAAKAHVGKVVISDEAA